MGEEKTQVISFRVSEETYGKLKKYAEEHGESVTALARRVVEEFAAGPQPAPSPRPVPPGGDVSAESGELKKRLGKVEGELEETREGLQELWGEVDEIKEIIEEAMEEEGKPPAHFSRISRKGAPGKGKRKAGGGKR